MVTTAVTWNSNLNVVVAGTDVDSQFQNIILELHTWFKAAGWTVLGSSNGVIANTSDNISVAADIVTAIAGVAHTWIAYRSPTAFAGAEQIEVVVDCKVASSPDIAIDMSASSGSLTGFTSILNRPTGPNEWIRDGIVINPTSTFVTKKMHMARSSDGEFWFGTSDDGTLIMERVFWFTNLTGGDQSAYPYAFFAISQGVSAGSFRHSDLNVSGNWKTHNPGDGAAVNAIEWSSHAQEWSLWVDGRANISNAAGIAPMELSVNNGTQGRFVGSVQDIKAASSSIPSGEVEDGDPDAVRRVAVDDAWLIVKSSQLPILL